MFEVSSLILKFSLKYRKRLVSFSSIFALLLRRSVITFIGKQQIHNIRTTISGKTGDLKAGLPVNVINLEPRRLYN